VNAKTLVLAVVVAATAWLLWPLLACGGACIVDFDASFSPDPLAGRLAAPDTRLNLWILWWAQHALLNDPRSLFDANVFWPAKSALAGSEHMLALAILTLPLRLLTDDAVVVYSGAIVLTSILTGLSTYALVRWITRDSLAALIAAAVAVLMPWRTSELVHLQLLTIGILPLVWLYCMRVLSEPFSLRVAATLALVWAVQLFSSYYAAYLALFSTAALVIVVMWVLRPRRSQWLGVAVATAIPALALAALSIPYLRTQGAEAVLLRGEMPRSLAPSWVLGRLTPSRWLGAGPGAWDRGYELPLAVLVLATAGIVTALLACSRTRVSRMEPPARARLAAVAGVVTACVVGLVMSFGWTLTIGDLEIPLPARFASAWIPGFANLRGGLRWTLVVCVAAPVLAGIGIATLRAAAEMRGTAAARAVALACAVVLIADLRPPRLAVTAAYAARTDEMPGLHALAKLPSGPVLDVPWPQNLVANSMIATEYMVASTVHAMPILAGYTAYAPRSYDLLLRAARNLPRPDAVRRLQALTGLRWIVLHERALEEAERAAWQLAAMQVPLVLAYRDDALTIYEAPAVAADPRVLAAVRSATPGNETVLGISRAALAVDATAGDFHVSLPAVLAGYGEDWMKSAVGVRIENRSERPWPGLDGHREGLLLVRYRLLVSDGAVVLDGLADLDADVPAGGALDTFVVLEGRVPAGDYRLELSLVQQVGASVVSLPFAPVRGPVRIAPAS